MSDLNPVLQARTELLKDICHKVAVAGIARGECVDLDVAVEQLQQKFRSVKEGVWWILH